MDSFKDIIDTFNNRVKSRIVGSILISFIVINWKVIFYIIMEPVSSVERFQYFDENSDLFSLFVKPIFFGTIVAVAMPWITVLGGKISEIPDRLNKEHRNRSVLLDARHKQDFQEELERSRAAQEQALIEAAKRDEEIQAISNPEIRERLEHEIEVAREEKPLSGSVERNAKKKENNNYKNDSLDVPFTLHDFQNRIEAILLEQSEAEAMGNKSIQEIVRLEKEIEALSEKYDKEILVLKGKGDESGSISLRVEKVAIIRDLTLDVDRIQESREGLEHRYSILQHEKDVLMSEFEKHYE